MGRYFNPVETYFGPGEIHKLGTILDLLKIKTDKLLLLTRGGSFEGSEDLKIILEQLKGKEVLKHDIIVSNPDISDLYDLKTAVGIFDYDIVLAIGGGSVLDTGKVMAALKGMEIASKYEIRDLILNKAYLENKKRCDWIAVPTTAGTGSEVTSWATVWDREKGFKYSIEGKNLYAKTAVIDPVLTSSMPPRLTVTTALDALCHAVEAYWAKSSNEVSRVFAVNAIKNIIQNLDKIIDDPGKTEHRIKLALGSFYAGLAFSNTKTTSCHSISYPLTLMYGIDHGIAASITLAKIMQLNEDSLIDKKVLFNAFGVSSSREVDSIITRIYEKSGLSNNLKDYGVTEAGLKSIADNAYTKGRMDNNPRDINKETLLELLFDIYG